MRERDYGRVIREARQARGLNQQSLAEQIGVSRNTVAGWETGHSRPDLNSVVPLCRALRISLNLFFGVKGGLSQEERKVLDLFSSLQPADQEIVRWEMEAILQRRGEMPERAKKSKPVEVITLFRSDLGAAAGFGAPLDASQGREINLVKDSLTSQADEVIAVSGHSMEPTFQDGDLVLVQHTQELREGEIGIFLVDGEGYIKEFRSTGLYSHNPAYGTMAFSEYNDVRCVGRVIGKVNPEQIPD